MGRNVGLCEFNRIIESSGVMIISDPLTSKSSSVDVWMKGVDVQDIGTTCAIVPWISR